MKYILFIDKEFLEQTIKYGVKAEDNYRGKGILFYPLVKVKCYGIKTNINFSIQDMWKLIGAQNLINNNKEVVDLVFKMNPENFPIKVFIDIRSEFSIKFANLFDNEKSGLKYSKKSNLTTILKKTSAKSYVLEGEFYIKNEIELSKLIYIFNKSKGFLRSAHSFDCFIEKNILPNQIIETYHFSK